MLSKEDIDAGLKMGKVLRIMEKYLTHDELIELIFQEYEKSDKKKYTSLFLSSLSTNQLS